jgi:catechol 2,3-dioxygenase-like lactoylglutathione lyase family enzyme
VFSTFFVIVAKAFRALNAHLSGMLGTTNIVAFLPTTDYARARAFFEGVLGLRVVSLDDFALVLDANGIMLRVTKVGEHKPWPFTILGWQVSDIEDKAAALAGRGVRFERYGFPGQDDAGIWTAPSGDKVAWFKDPDGNTLSLSQHV